MNSEKWSGECDSASVTDDEVSDSSGNSGPDLAHGVWLSKCVT